MFYWGGYSFQLPQQQEHPDRPPLKYPVYMPPTVSYLKEQQQPDATSCAAATVGNASAVGEVPSAQTLSPPSSSMEALLSQVLSNRLQVRAIACGLKHAVIVVNTATPPPAPAAAAATNDPSRSLSLPDGGGGNNAPPPAASTSTALYGLGSNHAGQLGHRVATYTNTLVSLNTGRGGESSFDGDIVSVACGLRHTLIATSKGCVYASGDNTYGQLGLGLGGGGGGGGRGGGKGGGAKVKTSGGSTGGDDDGGATASTTGVARFTQVPTLAYIVKVFAAHNASFALDARGAVYSWGDAQYGHLGHGDHMVADEKGGLDRVEHVRVPRAIRWFERRRVAIGDVAVGKGHALFMSRDGTDVYTCGEGYFGKLGHGGIDAEEEPRRLEAFPNRRQTEKVVAIGAGDDCSLVLKANPVMGSVVYFFGKLTNGDGQLRPDIIPFAGYVNLPGQTGRQQQQQQQPPSSQDTTITNNANSATVGVDESTTLTLTSVLCGRGNQCLALSADGRLFVWGKHAYAKLANGTNADAVRSRPTVVAALEKYVINGVASGGTLMAAWGSRLRRTDDEECATAAAAAGAKEEKPSANGMKSEEQEEEEQQQGRTTTGVASGHAWDVTVTHDARVSNRANNAPGTSGGGGVEGDPEEVYEEGTAAFLGQYYGHQYVALAAAYVAGMSPAPARTQKAVYSFTKVPVVAFAVGQKVRLWMTDLYAIGTVTKVDAGDRDNLSAIPTSSTATDAAAAAAAGGHHKKRSRSRSQSRSQTPALTPMKSQFSPPLPSLLMEAAAAADKEDDGNDKEGHGIGGGGGRRVVVEWERDDWRDEVVTLYSDDETLDAENANRWQPFWFEEAPEGGGYAIAKSR